MSKMNTRKIRNWKKSTTGQYLQMLTCYDYQTAQMLNDTPLNLILVGDSLGNVVLGHDSTVQVTLEEMIIFTRAVKRGAPDKFVIGDMPFGTYTDLNSGVKSAVEMFQKSQAEALKLEGAFPYQLQLIKRLTEIGIPVMGHIGVRPQSVHQQGGHYIQGRTEKSKNELRQEAITLQESGVFALVLECVDPQLTNEITAELKIPTIGIGSGAQVDGQVLVINDLFSMGKNPPPPFVAPMSNLFEYKKTIITQYLKRNFVDPRVQRVS